MTYGREEDVHSHKCLCVYFMLETESTMGEGRGTDQYVCACVYLFFQFSEQTCTLHNTLTFPLRAAFSAVSFFFITATGRATMTFVLS